jgi:hypothetical protein
MNCDEVKSLLSDYFDDELPSRERAAVERHLASCSDCTRELRRIGELSAMAKGLVDPEPPAQLWRRIEMDFLGQPRHITKSAASTTQRTGRWMTRPLVRSGLALAASLLLLVGWISYRSGSSHDHPMTAVFGEYLDQFQHDPDAAQQILVDHYQGDAIDPSRSVQTVGYRPVATHGLPDGYTMRNVYVMKMPCCTCVQCVCERDDGTVFVVFEHDEATPEWFGDRPTSMANCGGKPCTMVHLDQRLAATWRRGTRHLTIIGARNTAEVDHLVAWFDQADKTHVE